MRHSVWTQRLAKPATDEGNGGAFPSLFSSIGDLLFRGAEKKLDNISVRKPSLRRFHSLAGGFQRLSLIG